MICSPPTRGNLFRWRQSTIVIVIWIYIYIIMVSLCTGTCRLQAASRLRYKQAQAATRVQMQWPCLSSTTLTYLRPYMLHMRQRCISSPNMMTTVGAPYGAITNISFQNFGGLQVLKDLQGDDKKIKLQSESINAAKSVKYRNHPVIQY